MYVTIEQPELDRLNSICVRDLHYYKDLFQRLIIGRKADHEYYNMMDKNKSGFVYEASLRKGIDKQIVFFTERLEVINKRLDEMGLKDLKTSIN
jgi:hypothetical protein